MNATMAESIGIFKCLKSKFSAIVGSNFGMVAITVGAEPSKNQTMPVTTMIPMRIPPGT